jgi:hypothetical protein
MGVGDGVGVSGGAAVGIASVTVGRGAIVTAASSGVTTTVGVTVGVSTLTT